MEKADHGSLMLDHAWRHFEYHAKQRLSLFNFCIIWAGLVIAAWSQVMAKTPPIYSVGVFLGVLLSVSSLVFWRMDQRNSYLTKLSEEVLGRAESTSFAGTAVLFNTAKADKLLKKGWKFPFAPQWSHGQSLKVLFGLMALTGVMGAGFAALQYYCDPKQSASTRKASHLSSPSTTHKPTPRPSSTPQ
jgi:hypothetical protein